MTDILEEHRSPDGLLRFIVTRDEQGDISLGFDGFVWHTHADVLARRLGSLSRRGPAGCGRLYHPG
jgi:hypothetical protein